MNVLLLPEYAEDMPPPIVSRDERRASQKLATSHVSQCRHSHSIEAEAIVAGLDDAERESFIGDAGKEIERSYAAYEASSSLVDLGEAHYWRRLRDFAVMGRSAEQVAHMETERGLVR